MGRSESSAAPGWRIDATGRALIEGVGNGTELAPGLRLFHDGVEGSCHAALAPTPDGLAGHALELVTAGFGGGFVSLSITLPQAVLQGLTEDYLVAVHCAISADMPIEAYVRLTIRHGPNETRLVRSIDPRTQIDGVRHEIALDLYRSGLDPLRLTEAWCDVILNPASDGRIVLSDLAFSRRHRAPI